eukprot:CAMPEP_0204011148 /NCGR_PEP_ID=MMETSP0360-20130528/23050_1 /ASSEMBLY_ACC=CAM_ASM_000342 /TAXON_ID=268821 /ORGANISM="Scrippsiella Hangoei, Strain SHTV-5" /LENGTH=42 /DNA_ID= /DNA_START= /DNA_END= /DNA_ORIENTATION=
MRKAREDRRYERPTLEAKVLTHLATSSTTTKIQAMTERRAAE